MTALDTTTLDEIQGHAPGAVQLDSATKTHLRENQQNPANRASARSLSVASLEQFVRSHLETAKSMSLGDIAGTDAEVFVREQQQEKQVADNAQSPYGIAASMEAQQAAEKQAEQDADEKAYDEHVLTGQELAQFNQTMDEVKQESTTNHEGLDQWKAANDKTEADIKSREIHVDGRNLVLDTATGQYYDVDAKKDLDPQKDSELIGDADKQKKANTATKPEIDDVDASKKQQADAAKEQQDADDETKKAGTGTATGANNKQAEDAKQKADDVKNRIESNLQKNDAAKEVDRQAQIKAQASQTPGNTPAPPAPENKVAETEKKNVQEYNSANKETLTDEANRLKELAPVDTNNPSDSMHARFAALQAKGQANQQADKTAAVSNRTPSFVASQSGMNNDADDKLKKLGVQAQSAFNSGALGASPSANLAANNPSPINNNPGSASANKKAVAPAMA